MQLDKSKKFKNNCSSEICLIIICKGYVKAAERNYWYGIFPFEQLKLYQLGSVLTNYLFKPRKDGTQSTFPTPLTWRTAEMGYYLKVL